MFCIPESCANFLYDAQWAWAIEPVSVFPEDLIEISLGPFDIIRDELHALTAMVQNTKTTTELNLIFNSLHKCIEATDIYQTMSNSSHSSRPPPPMEGISICGHAFTIRHPPLSNNSRAFLYDWCVTPATTLIPSG